MVEEQEKPKRMGRPKVFKDPVSFEIKWMSRDLVEKIDAKRGSMARRAYLEKLLRSHPDL